MTVTLLTEHFNLYIDCKTVETCSLTKLDKLEDMIMVLPGIWWYKLWNDSDLVTITATP